MSNPTMSPAKRIYPRAGDAIRTVPLHVLETHPSPAGEVAATAATPPKLTYRHGPLIATPEVFTIFWGPEWESTQASLMTRVNQFFDFVLTSQLIDQLAEYSVPAYQIHHGRRTGTIAITNPVLQHSVSDTAVQHMLQHEISSKAGLPAPSPNTLYFVYLPPGVKVIQGGSASCSGFCGYHSDVSGQIFVHRDALPWLQWMFGGPGRVRRSDNGVVA